MKDCVFCKIVKKELPSRVVYEDKNILAFFPKDPEAKAHTLIIPKRHYENIFDIPEKELKDFILGVKNVSQLLKEKLGAEGVNILNASGEVAQQTVFHLHFHIIPRFKGDGIDAWMKNKDLKEYDLNELQETLISKNN